METGHRVCCVPPTGKVNRRTGALSCLLTLATRAGFRPWADSVCPFSFLTCWSVQSPILSPVPNPRAFPEMVWWPHQGGTCGRAWPGQKQSRKVSVCLPSRPAVYTSPPAVYTSPPAVYTSPPAIYTSPLTAYTSPPAVSTPSLQSSTPSLQLSTSPPASCLHLSSNCVYTCPLAVYRAPSASHWGTQRGGSQYRFRGSVETTLGCAKAAHSPRAEFSTKLHTDPA